MTMSIHEARHNDHIRSVNHFCAVQGQVRAHSRNLRTFEQYIGISEISQCRVHRENRAALKQHLLLCGWKCGCITYINLWYIAQLVETRASDQSLHAFEIKFDQFLEIIDLIECQSEKKQNTDGNQTDHVAQSKQWQDIDNQSEK